MVSIRHSPFAIRNFMSRIFKIARIGTKEITIEEAEDARDACWKANWVPEWCEAVDITDDLERAREDGTIYEVRVPQNRRRQIEDMFRQISRQEILKRLAT